MERPATRAYLISLPERVVRMASAIAAGVARELSNVTLPRAVRGTRLYQALVEQTLRFLIEEVGQVEGVYPPQGTLSSDYLLRRVAGHGVEWAGILTIHASPVWVLAALADVSNAGKLLVDEIAGALKEEGLLDPATRFETVDQILDGFEKSAGRLALALNTPPVDAAGLRAEWIALRGELRSMAPDRLPSPDTVRRNWEELKKEAGAQNRSVFALSTLMAISAVASVPENLLWLSRCARSGARKTGHIVADTLLDHYETTLAEIRKHGYLTYWAAEFRPYLKAAAMQLSPSKLTLTQRLVEKIRAARRK